MFDALPPYLPSIESERLSLLRMSLAFMQSSLDGRLEDAQKAVGTRLPSWWPDEETRRRLAMRLEQMESDPGTGEWLLRLIVERTSGEVVGIINFHGPPDEQGRAELGYTVFEAYRRRGYGTEAATTMMGWARREHGIGAFVVSISPLNEASLGMAGKMGFVRIGTQIDEVDGEEWVFELRLSSSPV